MPKVTPSLVSRSVNETSVRIVFLLTVNGRPLRQIKRLIKNLYDPKHYYYIHVDSVSVSHFSNSIKVTIFRNLMQVY